MHNIEEMAKSAVMAYAPDFNSSTIVATRTAGNVAVVHYRTWNKEGSTDIVYLVWGPSISNMTELARGVNRKLTLDGIKDEGDRFAVSVNGTVYLRSKLGMRLSEAQPSEYKMDQNPRLRPV